MPVKKICILVGFYLFISLLYTNLSAQVLDGYAVQGLADDTTLKNSNDTTLDKKEEKKKEEKPFEELIKDFQVIEGFFTFYRDAEAGKIYMEIKPEQFDKIYLCSMTREAADGFYFDSASMLGHFPFILKREGKKVFFIHKNVYYRADKDSAISRAVHRGLSDSIMGTAKIESLPHKERGSILIDPTSLFIQDIEMVSTIFSEYIKTVKYDFDKENSYFGKVTSFQENSEIDVVLHYKSSNPKPVPTLPDSRSFQHVYHYSLSLLPDTGYKPRIADDRIGHFHTMYQDYNSVLKETPYVRFINRWQLEKSEPKFKLSPPKKPIVFWLENSIPVEYRQAITKGVLLWNNAFEKIGFKDAIVVKQQPDDADWDAGDARYNTIRWMVQPGAGYAVGPSRTNPFTGQLYDADIRISADMLRYVFLGYDEFVKPIAIGDSYSQKLGLSRSYPDGLCDYAYGLAQEASFGWVLLSARTGSELNSEEMEKYIHDFLVDLVAHEVGHTLGLRHNFKSSALHTFNDLQDKNLTSIKGLSSSVMDYIPVNIAPEGQPQGEYFQTTLGPYDYWVIEYAYKEIDEKDPKSEMAILNQIAARSTEPELLYGTDEDTLGGAIGMDPISNRYDLSNDPILYFKNRIALSRELWNKMESTFEKDGNRYVKLRQVFNRGFGQYKVSVMNITKYIGGIYTYRDHIGDPNARPPFKPVPADQQREALLFLTENVFGQNAFPFSPELLNKLAPERYWDFTENMWNLKRIDFPVHDEILAIQKEPLNQIFDPVLLSRVLDIELRPEIDNKPLTLVEIFEEIRKAIWSELDSKSNIDSFRRSLQRVHLDKLINILLQPSNDTPEDARTLARADLLILQSKILPLLQLTTLDTYTKAHLDESNARIDAALKAGLDRRLFSPQPKQ